jgi:hypothetical protein
MRHTFSATVVLILACCVWVRCIHAQLLSREGVQSSNRPGL